MDVYETLWKPRNMIATCEPRRKPWEETSPSDILFSASSFQNYDRIHLLCQLPCLGYFVIAILMKRYNWFQENHTAWYCMCESTCVYRIQTIWWLSCDLRTTKCYEWELPDREFSVPGWAVTWLGHLWQLLPYTFPSLQREAAAHIMCFSGV